MVELTIDPRSDRIVTTGEKPGVVSMEALHADPGAGNPTRWSRPAMTSGNGGIALGGVAGMGLGDGLGGQFAFGPIDAALGLESPDGRGQSGPDQPITCRHRPAVREQGAVANDDWFAVLIAHDHLEVGHRDAPK